MNVRAPPQRASTEVERGVAAARSAKLRVRQKAVERLAARLVHEALVSDLPREDRAAAAVLAAWAVLVGRLEGRVAN